MTTAFVTGGSGFLGRNLIPYLIAQGWKVKALARSEAALKAVKASGAEPIPGDLGGGSGVIEAMHGCNVVIHAAAWANDWGDADEAWDANVAGTSRMLEAAQGAKVPRFVHVSTEAVLVDGIRSIHRVDETFPLPEKPLGLYSLTKGEAEKRVRSANRSDFQTVIVRPRFIWGKGDTTLLPRLIEATHSGALQWIGGGRYLTSTCHVTNVCEGIYKAVLHGHPGHTYFLTDGTPVPFRDIIEALLRTQGVTPPTRSVPRWLAHAFARIGDFVWSTFRLKGQPPLPHSSFHLIGEEVTVNDAKARQELGYKAEVTLEQGLKEMEGG